MTPKRFFCSPITPDEITLDPRQAHHLREVLRLHPGDPVEILDGFGKLAQGTIESLSPRHVRIAIDAIEEFLPRQTGRILIAASIAKGDRFEWLIEKCAELGIDRICPILFERTVKRPSGDKPLTRYQTIAAEAVKQSRQIFLPQIDPPLSFHQSLTRLRNEYPQSQILYGNIKGKTLWTVQPDFENTDYIVYIGPEGDLTDEEISLLQSAKARPIRLTPTVLRVETAALAFASCLTALRP